MEVDKVADRIIKEVMACDVSPVVMFYHETDSRVNTMVPAKTFVLNFCTYMISKSKSIF